MSFISKTDKVLGIGTDSKWAFDSGATAHMCRCNELFEDLREQRNNATVSAGNGNQAQVAGVGSILTNIACSIQTRTVRLTDVLFVPQVMCNLLSFTKMRKAGLNVTFDSDNMGAGSCNIVN